MLQNLYTLCNASRAQASQRAPTDKELAQISKGISIELRQLVRDLGLPEEKIDHIKEDYPFNSTHQIFEALYEWRKQRGTNATFNELEKRTITAVFVASPALCYVLPEEVSLRVPTDKELAKISQRIGKEFRQLGLHLGLSYVRIQQIQLKYPSNVVNLINQVLLEWRKQNGTNATFRELEKGMLGAGVDTSSALGEIH